MSEVYKVRIKVVRTLRPEDIYRPEDGIETPPDLASPCPRHTEGQEYVVDEEGTMPEGFCSWAWADIQREVVFLQYGGIYPWMGPQPDKAYVCCTDGMRPVFFILERMM